MTTPQLRQDIIDLYDEYTHRPLDRRTFLDRLTVLAGGAAAASALVPLLENNYARAQIVAEDDARLATETVVFAVAGGDMTAYVAKPADAEAPLPAVVVIHENRGLNPHIRDVARRAALAGYLAIAPDFLSPGGPGTPSNEDEARALFGTLDPTMTLPNALDVVAYARSGRPDVNGRVGTVGFCWGGGVVNQIAVSDPDVNASVSFYGRQPAASDVPRIASPLQLHYAGLDQRINAGIDDFVAALDAAGTTYDMFLYEDVNHAFHNDTSASRYDEAAATLAWQRTLAFFETHLHGA